MCKCFYQRINLLVYSHNYTRKLHNSEEIVILHYSKVFSFVYFGRSKMVNFKVKSFGFCRKIQVSVFHFYLIVRAIVYVCLSETIVKMWYIASNLFLESHPSWHYARNQHFLKRSFLTPRSHLFGYDSAVAGDCILVFLLSWLPKLFIIQKRVFVFLLIWKLTRNSKWFNLTGE